MATRAEIVERLANRRVAAFYLPGLTRARIRQAAQTLTDSEWDDIIAALRGNRVADIGTVLRQRVVVYLKGLAVSDVEVALSPDDTLSISELEGLL